MSPRVAALYIDPKGPYPGLVGVDMCWDAERDASTYIGPWPIVAHPPCGAWSSLRHLYRGDDKWCAELAIRQVRTYGGVLEHPITSALWKQLPAPGELPDEYGGVTVDVNQCDWGHVARKRTRLYLVGIHDLGPMPAKREPTAWCSGTYTSGQRGTVPPGIRVATPKERRHSPPAFAAWLIALAASVKL